SHYVRLFIRTIRPVIGYRHIAHEIHLPSPRPLSSYLKCNFVSLSRLLILSSRPVLDPL
ncbi:hypothetical protein GIB67_005290, partial [Kingdonia uniflora]